MTAAAKRTMRLGTRVLRLWIARLLVWVVKALRL